MGPGTSNPVLVDVRGMVCSDAVVHLHKALSALPAGVVVVVWANDGDVVADLERYAARSGHEWLGVRSAEPFIEAEVRRGA